MRLSITAGNPLERVLLALDMTPTPLVLGIWGMGASRCLLAATSLGVFDALAEGPKTSAEVAEAIGGRPDGTEALLDALNGFRLVRRRRGVYRTTRAARRWLVASSRFSLRDAVLFYRDMWDVLGMAEQAVLTGQGADLHARGGSPDFWERYMRGLATFARFAGAEVARKVPLDGAPGRLLDVAGGHGMYSAAFCRRYPGLTAEVLDLPEAVEHGRRLVAEAGLADRVVFREGDLRAVEWGTGYDVVLLFNIIHNVTPDEALAAMGQARDALRPGGVVAVLDSQHVGGDGDLSTAGGFNEFLFFLTSGTRAYPEETMRDWLMRAGFTRVRVRRLLAVPQAALMMAHRPADDGAEARR